MEEFLESEYYLNVLFVDFKDSLVVEESVIVIEVEDYVKVNSSDFFFLCDVVEFIECL